MSLQSVYLDLILNGTVDEDIDRQRHIMERSRDRAASLLLLIQDLLNISAIEEGKVAQQMVPVDLKRLLNEVVDLFSNEAQQNNVTLNLVVNEKLPEVVGDVEDLTCLFTNLISNAIKYNKENGSVTITTFETESHLHISIQDTGIGLSEEEKNKIFNQFYRAKNERTREIVGTGLGLSIAKKIIESHNGCIKVNSKCGEGSTFSVFLPLQNN